MAENQMHLPGGFGGLTRFNEEYESKLRFTPAHVIIAIILVIIFWFSLRIFLPISS
jgi:preprotein translocase subunit Sec61beta